MARIRHELRILIQSALVNLKRGRLPGLPSPLKFLRGDVHVQRVLHRVDVDDIPVLDERDRTSDLGLRDDVANYETVGAGDW